jgi:outer membrane protein assembly factor BamE (lipoprotein component of BamABCDE complex)
MKSCWVRFVLGLLAGLALMALTGCQTPAQRLEPGTADFIQPGVTTRAELVAAFGSPRQVLASEGRTLLFWDVIYWASYHRYKLTGILSPSEDSHARGLSVLLGPDDRVLAKHYSIHDFHTYFGSRMVSVGYNVKDQTLAQIKPGHTTQQEAVALLGEPMMESLTLNGDLTLDWAYAQANSIVGETEQRLFRVLVNSQGIITTTRFVDQP